MKDGRVFIDGARLSLKVEDYMQERYKKQSPQGIP
jgi:hypothetical protein